MPRFLRPPAFLGLGILAAAAAIVLTLGGGDRTAEAGGIEPQTDCIDLGEVLCISLDPEIDANTVGDDHTVTATLRLTVKGEPVDLKGSFPVVILVFDGPNAGESVIAKTDGGGQVSLTYPGDGGAGTDDIAAVACLEDLVGEVSALGVGQDPCNLDGFIDFCLADPQYCFLTLTEPDGTCAQEPIFICDVATKEWVEPTPTPSPTPTPTPTPPPPLAATATPAPTAAPTATPTPTPVVAAAAALPVTGGEPPDGGSGLLPWLAAIAGAMAMIGGGGLWLAYQRRRVR